MERLSPERRELLARNLARVRERIAAVCRSSGRAPEAVRLVCVTKSVDSPTAAALRELGAPDLGESRPQELRRKMAEVSPEGPWHFIGHLQRRVIKDAAAADLVHSVDRLRLIEALARLERCPPLLLQVNVSGEESKQGFAPKELPGALEAASKADLRVVGLMTMAPRSVDEAPVRATFSGLRTLRDAIATPELPLPELSMGMSGDFELAIEEGATLVRVGSALFEGLDAL